VSESTFYFDGILGKAQRTKEATDEKEERNEPRVEKQAQDLHRPAIALLLRTSVRTCERISTAFRAF
jgi:hypothetical protein